MTLTDYNFKVGDEVITIDGEKGKITYICECNKCKKRGFCEPVWKEDGTDEEHYITDYQARNGFFNFYRIGEYRFGDFNKDIVTKKIAEYEKEIERWKAQLKTFEEIEAEENAKNEGRVE